MRNATLRLQILTQLASGEDYAYAIYKQLRPLNVSAIGVNAMLHSMARNGLVASRIERSRVLRPGRRYYRLSGKGRAALRAPMYEKALLLAGFWEPCDAACN
jgi:DNA-binding PadR family transcriptional regulator